MRKFSVGLVLCLGVGVAALACSGAEDPSFASGDGTDGTANPSGIPGQPGAALPGLPGLGTPGNGAPPGSPATPAQDAAIETMADAGVPAVDGSVPPPPPRDGGTTVPSGPGPRPTRTCTYTKDADGFFQLTTLTGGYAYWVRLPPTYNPNTDYPLVVGTHGCGDNAKNFATWAMAPYASRPTQSHIAVAVGAGRDGQCWTPAQDEAKVLAVVDDVRSCFFVHQKKVTLAGYSSGGILAYYTAMRNTRRFAGLLIENSSLGSAFGAGTDAAIAAAGWKLNVAITAHTGDTQFPIANIRTDRTKLQNAGFPVQYRELAGTHDGNSDDWAGFLLPKVPAFLAP